MTSDASRTFLASNRGPVTFSRSGDERVYTRGAGGLVTALGAVARLDPDCVWVSSANSGEDAAVSDETNGGTCEVEDLKLAFVRHRRDDYDLMYRHLANPLLWFVQHGLYDLAPNFDGETRRAWEGYLAINHNFAAAIAEAVGDSPSPVVFVHDYHLYMVPRYLREMLGSSARISFFLHIPWPEPKLWSVLPSYIREAVPQSLLESDVVAFHTRRYARAFLATVRDVLGLEVDEERSVVRMDGREVRVRSHPISIDPPEFQGFAASEEVAREEEILRDLPGKLLLRVDRMDPSKNIVRGFQAFERMLERYPVMHGKVTFLAQLQPSREDISEYAAYAVEIRSVVDEVNERYGTADWTPVVLTMQDNFSRSVAAYKNYDVLLVNAVRDGMNLVAKEAVFLNERNGVLVLSEEAGAFDELGEGAVVVDPFDLDQQADAIYEALTMPEVERREKADLLRQRVLSNTIRDWADAQMRDVMETSE